MLRSHAALPGLALASLCWSVLATGNVLAQDPPAIETIPFKDALVLPQVGRGGRSPVRRDAVESAIVSGAFKTPAVGDKVELAGFTTGTWEEATAGDGGGISHPAMQRGAYVLCSIKSETPKTMILAARGHNLVYVNGELRPGDPYGYGFLKLPVALKQGDNQFLFACSRGELNAKLVAPGKAISLDPADATLPDAVMGDAAPVLGAVTVVNAEASVRKGLTLTAKVPGGEPRTTTLPAIMPNSASKATFEALLPAVTDQTEIEIELTLQGSPNDLPEQTEETVKAPLDVLRLKLPVKKADEPHRRTFASQIDGSVQYYAVLPAKRAADAKDKPALFLTLHGAGVEATGQAAAYSSRDWGHLVAATNRRPYGFDWEDWGRLDAIEVLEEAQKKLATDPERTYLTGHSMGGHGTWHVGLSFPDRFAAIGPSAGWVSFQSYAGAAGGTGGTPQEEMIRRAASPSDTVKLAKNCTGQGVFILHGANDDNVPVGQARFMRQLLAGFHSDFAYFEQPGAGHWWDGDVSPGADCVDWEPMFEFFRRHKLANAGDVKEIDFVTASPAVSSRMHWATIESQQKALTPSTIGLKFDKDKKLFSGKTENVARLHFDLKPLLSEGPLNVELDGQKLDEIAYPADGQKLWLVRDGEKWRATGDAPAASLKGPLRYGPFREAFRNRAVLVYGTQGTLEENAWSQAKVRYDAETFWYRGNGAFEVSADVDYDPAAEPNRNVILYGNADINSAWPKLLAASPVQVRRGIVQAGGKEMKGDDLACFFLRPRVDGDTATVGVVAGTGMPGLRLTDRSPYFISGAAYPDLLVINSKMLTEGAPGILAAGYFGNDWSLTSGEFAGLD